MKKIFYTLTAFLFLLMGVFRYPLVSFALPFTYGTLVTNQKATSAYIKDYWYRLNTGNDIRVVGCTDGNSQRLLFYSLENGSVGRMYNINGNQLLNLSLYNTRVINGTIVYYNTTDSWANNFLDSSVSNIPVTGLSVNDFFNSLTFDNLGNLDLGYISEVGYHVDSYGLEHNPSGTNEMISWGQYTTTGLDLSPSNFSVEFMIKDNSTSFLGNATSAFFDNGLAPLPSYFGNALNFMQDIIYYGAELLYKDDACMKALASGAAMETSLNNKSVQVSKVTANTRKSSFNAMSFYKSYFADSVNAAADPGFKEFIDNTDAAPSRMGWFDAAKDLWNTKNTYYNISYNIYARIVDDSTGQKGDWLMVNKHNTPYISSDSDNRLNGGYTAVTGVQIPNYNPTSIFTPTPDPVPIDPDPNDPESPDKVYTPVPLITGTIVVDLSDSSTTINNYYTNYYYNYGDSIVDGHVTNEDVGNVNAAFHFIKEFFPYYRNWFRTLFGPFLPNWAENIVFVLFPVGVTGIIFRIFRTILPVLIDVFVPDVPRLPGS